jgi:DNA-directed RNA polymerase specialized sigma24 family protein
MASYGSLYERYLPQVKSQLARVFSGKHSTEVEWGSHVDYEDLSQVIFIKAMNSIRNYSQKVKFATHLRTITYCVSHNHVRFLARKRDFLLSQSAFSNEGLHQVASRPDEGGLSNLFVLESCEFVNNTIDFLPDSQKMAVILAFLHDDFSSPNNLFKAKAALKPKFQRYFQENFSEVVELAR